MFDLVQYLYSHMVLFQILDKKFMKKKRGRLYVEFYEFNILLSSSTNKYVGISPSARYLQ